jgi:hypothetical protein
MLFKIMVPILLIGFVAFPGEPAAELLGRAPHSYALFVANRNGGPGQNKLRYAHRDAKRLRRVLTELGDYGADESKLLLEPQKSDVLKALNRIATKLAKHAQNDEPARFLFYYSGHARARSLNIGTEELALDELRRLLVQLPATTTVAILDACQTGAISQIKGASPTADFSYNSVNDLNTKGVVVMASSSASELSQESESLQSSFFTHHLVVGLRGAADDDNSGGVTLNEAYRYAYNRTLISTAKTAVGKQHVTLETSLKGKGELLLTSPRRATSSLVFAASLESEVLVHDSRGRHVLAELHKSKGKEVRLALPPGSYVTWLRQGKVAHKCLVTLNATKQTQLQTRQCEETPFISVADKGKGKETFTGERWALELAVGVLLNGTDDYQKQLQNFGFDPGILEGISPSLSVAVAYSLNHYFSVGMTWTMLDRFESSRTAYDLDGQSHTQKFSWETHGIGAFARITARMARDIVQPYLQTGLGLAWATSRYTDGVQASPVVDDQLHWGVHLTVGTGLAIMPWRHLGIFAQAEYVYAPVIKNLVDDTHDSGGFRLFLGLRGAL